MTAVTAVTVDRRLEVVEEVIGLTGGVPERRFRRQLVVLERVTERRVQRVEVDRRRPVVVASAGRDRGGVPRGRTPESRLCAEPVALRLGVLSLSSHRYAKC